MNEENNSNQPPQLTEIPEFLQGEKWFGIDIENDFLDFEEPYRPPRYTLSRMGVPFANVGELHIITGKPGNGKTGLMSQLMAAILCGKFGNTEYVLEERPKPKVLYIDTEQGKDDTIAVKNRVCSLAGLDYTQPQEQFVILRLRDTEDAKDRWRKILKAIYKVQPTDIFLDGLLDIVKDYNDQVECQPIVRECMMAATHYDASLWSVLHENPLVDKLVGTLGSIAQRKVAEIFTVKKIKQGDLKPTDRRLDRPDIYFQVKQVKARGRDVADWDFQYVTNVGGWGQPVELGEVIEDPDAERKRRENKEADTYFKQFNWTPYGTTYTDLERFLRTKGVTSNRKIAGLFNTALESGIIYKDDKKKYHYKGIGKELPDDRVESIPFEPNNGNEEAPF